MPEIVEHEVNGLLVEPGDEQGLAQALIRLLDDPGLRQTMGMQGRQRVETRFSVSSMVDGNLSVYRRVLSAASR
jgi:glycosyltransferase involved in cell wall biosynthesis